MGSRKRSQQVSLRSYDADFVVGDLDTLRQGAQVIPPIAAPFEMNAFASRLRKPPDHGRADCLMTGAVQHGFGPLGIQLGLIADHLETGYALFQRRIVEIGHASLDSVVKTLEA